MNKYILDTSFISALVNEADIHHQSAIEIYEKLPNESNFFLPATVKLELSIFFNKISESKKAKPEELLKALGAELIQINEKFLSSFNKFVKKTKLQLKTIDYSILFCSISKQAELLSFDKQLKRLHLELR